MSGNYLNDFNEAYQQSLTALKNLKDLCEKEGKRGEDLAKKSKSVANSLKQQKKSLKKKNSKHDEHNKKHKMLCKIDDIDLKIKNAVIDIKKVSNSTKKIRDEHPIIEMLDEVHEEFGKQFMNENFSLDLSTLQINNVKKLQFIFIY